MGFLVSSHSSDLWGLVDKVVQRFWGSHALYIAAPPGLHSIPPWHRAAQTELQGSHAGPRRTILQRLVDDGDTALEFLAAAGGVTKREALARVLPPQVVHANATLWGL